MSDLKFSNNWNRKLTGTFFTSIRKFSEFAEKNYQEGGLVNVLIDDVWAFRADVVRVVKVPFRDIPEPTLCCDTGYSLRESMDLFKRMYKLTSDEQLLNMTCLVILCKRFKSEASASAVPGSAESDNQ